jgi:hypothetical protein
MGTGGGFFEYKNKISGYMKDGSSSTKAPEIFCSSVNASVSH